MRKSFSLSAFCSAVRNWGQCRATWWNAYIRHSTYENWSFGAAVSALLLSVSANSSVWGNGIYSCTKHHNTDKISNMHTNWNTLLSHCSYTITYHCNTIICPLGINKLSILLWCKVRTLKRIYELCQFHKSYKIYHTWLLKIGQVICIICTFTSNSDLCIRF